MRPTKGGFELQGPIEINVMAAALQVAGRQEEAQAIYDRIDDARAKFDRAHPDIAVIEKRIKSMDPSLNELRVIREMRDSQIAMDSIEGTTYESTSAIPSELAIEIGFAALAQLSEYGLEAREMLESIGSPESKIPRWRLSKLLRLAKAS